MCATSSDHDATSWIQQILARLDKFRRIALFCDTELRSSDGRHFYGHSSVLAAACPVLHQQFFESKPGVYVVHMPIESRTLGCILNYIYTGRWELRMGRVKVDDLEQGIAVMGLQRNESWSFLQERQKTTAPDRPQKCRHGKPLCKKRTSQSVGVVVEQGPKVAPPSTTTTCFESENQNGPPSPSPLPGDTEPSLSGTPETGPTSTTTSTDSPPPRQRHLRGSPISLELDLLGTSLLAGMKGSLGGSLESLREEDRDLHRLPSSGEGSSPKKRRLKKLHDSSHMFRHVKFTAPVAPIESPDSENIPPLVPPSRRRKVDPNSSKPYRKVLKLGKPSKDRQHHHQLLTESSTTVPDGDILTETAATGCRGVIPGHDAITGTAAEMPPVQSAAALPYNSSCKRGTGDDVSRQERAESPMNGQRLNHVAQHINGGKSIHPELDATHIALDTDSSSSSSSSSDSDSSDDDDDVTSDVEASEEEKVVDEKVPLSISITGDEQIGSPEIKSPKGTEVRPAETSCSTSSKARIKASQTGVKFLRHEILHKWILDEETKESQWYIGKVMSVVSGSDGALGAVYQVDYKGEGVYDVDHLMEDYLEGSLSIMS